MAHNTQMSREVSGVVFSYYDKDKQNKSEYHEKCTPRPPKPAAAAAPVSSSGASKAAAVCDVVTQDKIWKQSVVKETDTAKEWKENWGFLTEYDDKGRPKTPTELPETVNMFSETVPNTNAGNYGARTSTELGQRLQSLEFQFHSANRRKKMGKDLVCY